MQLKIAEFKAKLAEAKTLLKDKADKRELEKEKQALEELTAEKDVVKGKTKATSDAYNLAKTEAEKEIAEAKK